MYRSEFLEEKEATMAPGRKIFINELKGIKTFDLISKAANVFEKFIWGVIFIFGIVWVSYFLANELQSWQVNPLITVNKNVELSDIPNPAITFCSQSSTKFAIAERLGNYFNPNNTLPEQLIKIGDMLIKYSLREYQGSDCSTSTCKVRNFFTPLFHHYFPWLKVPIA